MTAIDDMHSEERSRPERLDAIASARAASSAEEARAIGVAYRAAGDHGIARIARIALERGYKVASTWRERQRNGLRPLQDLLQTLDELCAVLDEVGDTMGVEAVTAQKERVAHHLARLQ